MGFSPPGELSQAREKTPGTVGGLHGIFLRGDEFLGDFHGFNEHSVGFRFISMD